MVYELNSYLMHLLMRYYQLQVTTHAFEHLGSQGKGHYLNRITYRHVWGLPTR